MDLPIAAFARACLLLAGLLVFPSMAQAQAVSTLHSFGDGSVTNDGQVPVGALVQGTDGNFYGTTPSGGSASLGTVFKLSSGGVLTILHSFGDGSVVHDGASPVANLIQALDGNLYGTTSSGGSAGKGTVFEITPQGVVTILHSFGDGSVSSDGAAPTASLIQGQDGNFYSTTSAGGSAGHGTIFEITAQQKVTILHNFGDGTVTGDGALPQAGLIRDATGNFYGTTVFGGANGVGAIYMLNPQGQESILYSFNNTNSYAFTLGRNPKVNGAGGYFPNSRLLMDKSGNLYGTTAASGYGAGTIYKLTPQGQETVLHYFDDGSVSNDGCEIPPVGNTPAPGQNALLLGSDGNIYGTTSGGGESGKGTIFQVTPAGVINILHSFQGGTVNDGATPLGGIIQGQDGNFYGTTSAGGSAGDGAVFEYIPAAPVMTNNTVLYGGVNQAFSFQVLATNSPNSYSAIGLPAGLAIDNMKGLISGYPTAAGTYNVTLTVANASGSDLVNLVVTIVSPPVITSILSEFGSTSAPFDYQITASGGQVTFNVTGLPAGLTFNATTGLITGTPTVTGTFQVTLTATNLAGSSSSTMTLVVTSAAPTLSSEYVLLHSLNDGSVNQEGIYPDAIVQGQDKTFYGVTAQGGAQGSGTSFNLSAAGSASVLSVLGGTIGALPQGMIQGIDGNFYGSTQSGGSANEGTIFKMTPAGVITVLHTFGDGSVANDGANPQAGVIQASDGNFYGTTQNGGSANLGTIYRITPQGAVTILHSFGDGSVTNDGSGPVATLLQLADGNFYGTTPLGGSANSGTVFKITPQGAVTILHSFADGSVTNDGYLPHAALVRGPSNNLVGTTVIGGSVGKGTVFQITTAGVETILHNFDDGSVTNDGINPLAPVVYYDNLIFGTTQNGGAAGEGTIFELDSSNNETIIHSFDDGTTTNDGQNPVAGLFVGADGNLYGTALSGGAGYGIVYAIVANLAVPTAPTVAPTSYWSLTGNLPTGMTFDSSSGTISGTPLSSDAAGTYSVTLAQTVNGSTSATHALAIKLAAPTPQTFNEWKTSYAIANVASPTSNDGVPTLLKYLCDIDPTQAMTAAERSALPAFSTTASGDLLLTYHQNALATGVAANVQVSSDLTNWAAPPDGSYTVQKTGTDANGDAIMVIDVKTSGSTQMFIRLNVTSQ